MVKSGRGNDYKRAGKQTVRCNTPIKEGQKTYFRRSRIQNPLRKKGGNLPQLKITKKKRSGLLEATQTRLLPRDTRKGPIRLSP